MDRRWLPLNALRAFEAVGRHGSFTAASQSLLVSQSAVSRHVIGLEDFLGVALFDRKPQQLTLTDAGRRLLPVVEKAYRAHRFDARGDHARARRAAAIAEGAAAADLRPALRRADPARLPAPSSPT